MSGYLEIEGIRIPDDPAIITPKIRRSIEAGRYEREERAGIIERHEIADLRPLDTVFAMHPRDEGASR